MGVEDWSSAERSDRHDALATLSNAVRRLVEATVATGEGPDDLRAVAAEVDVLTERVGASRDDDPWFARSWGAGITEPSSLMGINPVMGSCNPVAPLVDWKIAEDGSVQGTVRFGLAHVGPPYRAHGGLVAAVLDQLLGVATIAAGSPGMTGRMTVKYRHATPLHEDLRCEAAVTSAEGRTSHAHGAIYDAEGRVTAEAEAMFIQPRRARTDE